MKTGTKWGKKICKNIAIGWLKKCTYETNAPGPVFAGFFPLLLYGISDKESSHVVGNSYMRRC